MIRISKPSTKEMERVPGKTKNKECLKSTKRQEEIQNQIKHSEAQTAELVAWSMK